MSPQQHSHTKVRSEILPLVRLSVPLIAGLVTTTLLMLTDTYMLGPLGEIPLAAASLSSSVVLIFLSALYGFMGPVGILVGRAAGARDFKRVAAVLKHSWMLGLALGVAAAFLMMCIYFALPWFDQPKQVVDAAAAYWILISMLLIPFTVNLAFKQTLDAIDRPWTGVSIMFIAVVANIPLNYALIYGHWGLPRLGLLGAGVASFAAEVIAALAFVSYFRFASSMRILKHRSTWDASRVRDHTHQGFPMAMQYAAEGGSVSVGGVLIGLLGATALAANQIVFSVGSLIYMVPLGMAGAVAIRIAQSAGAGDLNRIRPIGFASMILVTAWTVLFTALLVIAGRAIARAFVDDEDIITIAGAMFIAIGVMQIVDGIQSVSLGALRGILDNRWPTIVTLIAYWLLALPLGYLFAFWFNWGAAGVWTGFGAGLAFAAWMLYWRFSLKSADIGYLRGRALGQH